MYITHVCTYVGAFVGTASEDIRSGAPKVSMDMYVVYITCNRINNNLVVIDCNCPPFINGFKSFLVYHLPMIAHCFMCLPVLEHECRASLMCCSQSANSGNKITTVATGEYCEIY